jgi:Protein tyrosine and serine/threonine kinase
MVSFHQPEKYVPFCETNAHNFFLGASVATVWMAGCTFIEIFSRQDPHGNQMTSVEVAMKVSQKQLRPEIPANCPVSLRSVVASCFEWEPADRPTFAVLAEWISSAAR